MAAKSALFDGQLLSLIFNQTPIAGLGVGTTTTTLPSLYVSLHKAAIDQTASQAVSETTYAGYSRIAVSRVSGVTGWVVSTTASTASATPGSNITFPSCASASTDTISYFAVGLASSGAGQILYWGPISPTIAMAQGVIPQLTTGSTVSET